MNRTQISWTDRSWNPVTGCSQISIGCKNCYAKALSKRFGRSFEVTLHPERLDWVKRLKPGEKCFVNSMSDLFHSDVPTHFIGEVIRAMESRPDCIFQVLTKRPRNMVSALKELGWLLPVPGHTLKNVWWGVSVENGAHTDRIVELSGMPETQGKRFVSFEPLLGPIQDVYLKGIDWVIIGGESGPGHRPMDIEWARSIVQQAKAQGAAVWMKQLGGPRAGTPLEDLPDDLRIREMPQW